MLYSKYQRWHDAIIDRARARPQLKREEGEDHHIVPKSFGGTNHKENIVRLTHREHFLIHWLLTKFVEGESKRKMQAAFAYISAKSKVGWRCALARKTTSEMCRGVPLTKEHREKVSLSLLGNTRSVGRKHPEEVLAKMRISRKGLKPALGKHWKLSPETRARQGAAKARWWAEQKGTSYK